MNLLEIIGKRLKSSKDQVIYVGFPNSQETRTLPAGKPSPLIGSYLPSGWYELEGTGSRNLYIKDSNQVKVIEPDAKDESAFLSGLTSGVFDFFGNTQNKIIKQAGFLNEGFKESVSSVNIGALTFYDEFKKLLYIGIGILILILISKVIK